MLRIFVLALVSCCVSDVRGLPTALTPTEKCQVIFAGQSQEPHTDLEVHNVRPAFRHKVNLSPGTDLRSLTLPQATESHGRQLRASDCPNEAPQQSGLLDICLDGRVAPGLQILGWTLLA